MTEQRNEKPVERAIVLASVSTPEQAKKISMEDQERDGLAYCHEHNMDVVDVIRIPGYSRRYITLRELVEAASAKGHAGPARLEDHLNARDFNVLVVRTTSRFGREQAINAEIITKVVKWCKGRIIPFWEGMPIDRRNYRAMIMITGYRDSMEVDELVQKRRGGIRGLLSKGLPPNGRIVMSHRLVRDPKTGKVVAIELVDELRPMWTDLATLLFENVPYDLLEQEMWRRWKYGRDGRPYGESTFQRLLKSATFWGNQSLRIREDIELTQKRGLWVFDPSLDPPNGTDMYWNTHEPVYTGDLAERVKAELRRRTEVSNGVARSSGVHTFTALVVCADCHWRYAYQSQRLTGKKPYIFMRCAFSNRRKTDVRPPCSNNNAIAEWKIREWLQPHLTRWVECGTVDFQVGTESGVAQASITQLRASATLLERRVSAAAAELLNVDDDLKPFIREQLRAAKDDLDRTRQRLRSLERDIQRQAQTSSAQTVVLDEIRALGLHTFWMQPPLFINARLHALMDPVKLVGKRGQIVGFRDMSQAVE